MILLDTDIMIDVLREYPPALAWLATVQFEEIGLPGFVALELYQGCKTKIEQTRVKRTLSNMEIIWPDAETCAQALTVYVEYHLSHSLGTFDALIGQLAVALQTPLFTFNVKHYASIPNLTTIQPYARSL